jgi:hypothetical protein
MRRRSRLRRVLKWGGLVMSLLIVLVFVASMWWYVGYLRTDGQRAWAYSIESGSFIIIPVFRPPPLDSPTAGGSVGKIRDVRCFWTFLGVIGSRSRPRNTWFYMPLWIPFLLFALPTTFLFWRDRRRIPPGHYQRCRYDLTANTSGVCPECGNSLTSSPRDS